MQLDLLDERRLKAAEHAQSYRQRVVRQYAKSVIERRFKVNDLVLRSHNLSQASSLAAIGRQIGKVLYVIKEALPRNSYRLINVDGVELPDPINARHLKKFYT